MKLSDIPRDPLGTPCWRCGISDAHEHASMWPTKTKWAVRIVTHWQARNGIWWSAIGSPRYFRSEDRAKAIKEAHDLRVIDHDLHWSTTGKEKNA